jgi:hypothetical protein
VKKSMLSGVTSRREYASASRSPLPSVSSIVTALVTARSAASRRPGSVKVFELNSWPNIAWRYCCCRRTRSKSPPGRP